MNEAVQTARTTRPSEPATDRRWRPYPAYRDSGIEWLGRVPEHWPIRRLRHVAACNPTRNELRGLDGSTEVSFVPMELVREGGGLDLSERKPLAEVGGGYTNFRDGDVLVAKITPCFENGKGAHALGLLNGVGFGTTELHVLRPRAEVYARFLFYVTMSQAFRRLGAAAMFGAAGQQRVPDSFVRDFRVGVPPVAEQRAIAAFLDRETARIDALVEKKQRLIELLREKRQAVITQAVTRGLDPDVPMKESGVEWLGRVPEHWVVARLGRFLSYGPRNGVSPPSASEEEGVPSFSIAAVRDGRVSIDESVVKYVEIDAGSARQYATQPGDILLVRGNGSLDLVGRCGILESAPEGCVYPDTLMCLRPGRSMSARYMVWQLNCAALRPEIELRAHSATGLHKVSNEDVRNLRVVLPPLEEQAAIERHIGAETARIDALVSKLEQSIGLLREHRQALITAAVTGQIDVRDEVKA